MMTKDIVDAFKEKGWNPYASDPLRHLDQLHEVILGGGAEKLELRQHYILMPSILDERDPKQVLAAMDCMLYVPHYIAIEEGTFRPLWRLPIDSIVWDGALNLVSAIRHPQMVSPNLVIEEPYVLNAIKHNITSYRSCANH
ncbi:hypothetical protein H6504_01725 [Candidatus Woesearchaeota archaeon]|nr:hypothetical protein [Candidatus Woesearchaeota archaeon]